MSAEPISPATTPVAVPRRIKGPSALGTDLRRFGHLTLTLAITDFKLKFFGSVLGYLWQLMRPLMLFGVLYVVFTEFVRLGGGEPPAHWALMLLTAIVLYTFFAAATGGAVRSVMDRENLVRKIEFPRLAIPLSVVLVAFMDLLLNLIVVFVFLAAEGVEPRIEWLQFPLLVLMLGFFATGIATMLSALYVRYRDVQPIWEVALQVLFYASPILYPLEMVADKGGETAQQIMMMNPFAMIIEQVRYALIDPAAPSAGAAAGGWLPLAIPIGLISVVFVAGFLIFDRAAPHIAEEL